uniref:Uncharacterized protein n=1 Tax=Anguilla anguilla TaxID=7936 RepID=A0A0E9V0J5_ANGAN
MSAILFARHFDFLVGAWKFSLLKCLRLSNHKW